MNDAIIYLLKVSLGLGIIGIPYYFLLRNDPNLSLKRLYLLSGLAVSWIFPLLVFHKPEVLVSLTPSIFLDLDHPMAPLEQAPITATDSSLQVDWIRMLIYTYLGGLSLMFLKNLVTLMKWNLSWHRHKNDIGVAFTQSDQVFTLFNRIFVPLSMKDEEDLEQIIQHERAHVQQLHFIDLMAMELTLLLTWFNPFSWLISRMIKENHEHLADRKVLSGGINPARYRAQLLNHTLGVSVFRLGNPFNHSLTLNRFKMMKKPEKSPLGIVKIAFLVPLILLVLGMSTGMSPAKEVIVKGVVIDSEEGEPLPGTSVVVKGGTTGTVADVDGSFSLTVDSKADLVFSFVGYDTRVVAASKIGSKPVKMKVGTTTYDLDDVSTGGITFAASQGLRLESDGHKRNPVIVLDGEVVYEMEDLDPKQIEKIEVLKDPEHELVKKYNATDGLVIISTKDARYVSKKDQTVAKKSTAGESGEEIFYIVEDMPMFPGGKVALKSYIYSNLDYPELSKNKRVEGEVLVKFKVTAKGKVTEVSIAQGLTPELDAAAMNVFQAMPDWIPGTQRGKPVHVYLIVPVVFPPEKQ